MLKRIQSVDVVSNYCLMITYTNGRQIKLDFKKWIDEGGVFSSLNDPQIFKQVSIGGGGRFLQWPGNIDFCAESLWLEGTGEVNPYLESERKQSA